MGERLKREIVDRQVGTRRVPREFYTRDTITVAQELIGKVLVHQPEPGRFLAGMIVETEAYLGVEDPAAHTFGGRKTARNQSMYLAGGHAYVYQIYGLHFCVNVVTRNRNEPEAVLIRALEPLHGLTDMANNRGSPLVPPLLQHLTAGPGRLCQALGLSRAQDGTDLVTSEKLFITDANKSRQKNFPVECGERIGIDFAGDAAIWPLRFAAKGHFCISKPFKPGSDVAFALQS